MVGVEDHLVHQVHLVHLVVAQALIQPLQVVQHQSTLHLVEVEQGIPHQQEELIPILHRNTQGTITTQITTMELCTTIIIE